MIIQPHAATVLITGGAGYIGSHISFFLAQRGYDVVILDTLNHNQTVPLCFRQKVSHLPGTITLIKKDFADKQTLQTIFSKHVVQAVIHCAALIEVGDSVKNPRAFYRNNVVKTVQLLETMLEYNVKKIIFSSSCAVYGTPQYLPLTESHTKNPISPYGNNKYIIEMLLQDFHTAYDLEFVSLRYFNAAGAFPEQNLGEQHNPETHLIPLLLRAAYEKKPFYIFGTDYNTKDGTCIRDFLHVRDLVDAHHKALNHLIKKMPSDYFNLGTGHGYSVKECIDMVQRITGLEIKTIIKKRRAGDPPVLVANRSKAYNILDWKPHYSDLEYIIKTANQFYKIYAPKNSQPLQTNPQTR